jgi:predicted RNA-binding Zn-ribbon protein involved in translation (DUF1610 family)
MGRLVTLSDGNLYREMANPDGSFSYRKEEGMRNLLARRLAKVETEVRNLRAQRVARAFEKELDCEVLLTVSGGRVTGFIEVPKNLHPGPGYCLGCWADLHPEDKGEVDYCPECTRDMLSLEEEARRDDEEFESERREGFDPILF